MNSNDVLEKEENSQEIKNEETKINEIESIIKTKIEEEQDDQDNIEAISEEKSKSVFSLFFMLVGLLLIILLVFFFGFFIFQALNENIISGVYIKGVDVSSLSKSDAKYQLEKYFADKLPEEIKLKHNDFETTISLQQMDAKFDIESAINSAFSIGRNKNFFENTFSILGTLFSHVNVEPCVILNESLLKKNLEDISAQLPDRVTQSSYYIEDSELLITSGKEGVVVDTDATIKAIRKNVANFSTQNNPVELIVKAKQPEQIDVEKIYNEVRKDPVDAYYTKEPFSVHPSENGIDFKISLDEAKSIINSEKKDEYSIPLSIITPKVTTNMIGTEAFPDLLSTFYTTYAASNKNRTTNLVLAANKINGTVLMPGEVFSYNKVVGERTISAGYKEAPIYVSGQVVDGLGGGICQITSTLYNAVVYANLEIVQRTNHQFVPSYVTASRDATVVYGAIDFQFKNNRNYPIKLVCSVSGGVATFKIFGMKQENDCEVQISSYQTGRTATAIYSEAYKILKRNGQVVDKVLLSKDTYKIH